MNRVAKVSLVFSVFFLSLLVYVGVQNVLIYDALYKVNIEIEKVIADELTETKAILSVTMNIFNPGLVDVRITRFLWEIYLNDELIGSNDAHPNKLIPPSKAYIVTKQFEVKHTQTLHTLLQAHEQNKWVWRIVGSARFDTPLFKMEIPFDKELISSD